VADRSQAREVIELTNAIVECLECGFAILTANKEERARACDMKIYFVDLAAPINIHSPMS